MEQIFEFTYLTLCLIGAAFTYASFHYFMKGKVTDSPELRYHSELMMAACFCMAFTIATLVATVCLFRIIH